MDEYFARFGGVRDYLRDVVIEAGKQGVHRDDVRAAPLPPDLTSDNRQRREMAERDGPQRAHPGSAADIMKVAMLGVDRELTASGARSRILLQVHDELVLEVASGSAKILRPWSAGRWDQRPGWTSSRCQRRGRPVRHEAAH